MIDVCNDFLLAKRFGNVAFVCVIFHFLCGLVFTAITAALRVSESGKFSCSVDATSTATFKKQVDQACFARYDQAYNSPIPFYGFVLLSIDFTVLVSVIYSALVWTRVEEIESRHERQIDGKAVNRNRKTVYVFYSYFAHLVLRGLFVTALTVFQCIYFYPNGFDFKFNCNLPPTDQVTSNINTSKNASRNFNCTSLTCENGTASEKWLSSICVLVINSIVALVILGEVFYLLPRLPFLKRRFGVGWNCDSEFVIKYLLGKECIVPDESVPLANSIVQECSTIDNDIRDIKNEDNPDSVAQEYTTIDNGMQDFGFESCIDFYKKHVLSRSRDPGIIYGPNANINDLYIDVVIHTGRARYNFPEKMKKRHEIYDVYMEVPLYSICLERIVDLFCPNKDTEGEVPRSILVIGRPGIGKTVLTQKIFRDWANGIEEYYSEKIVFFFKFRWFNENFNELKKMGLKTFLRLGTRLSEEKFESIYDEIVKEPQKAILIFDGLDEYHGDLTTCLDRSPIIPNDLKAGLSVINLFIKLVLGDLLKRATVVVTSRPTAVDFYTRLDFDRKVEIIGFTFGKIEEYVRRFCDNNKMSDLATKIWNHVKSSSELLNLCYIPVNCFIVCVTLSGCLSDARNQTGSLPTTLTELYQAVFDHVEKYHHRNANITAHEALQPLERLAFLGMQNKQLVFNQTLFDEEMKTSGLLNSLSNPIFPLQTQFCFIHLTIQEFLAARHVTETFAPPQIRKFISDHVGCGEWHLVLQFIAGLLGKKIKNFDIDYKDCVYAFAKSLKLTCDIYDGMVVNYQVTYGIDLYYQEVFIMKCLREVDSEEIIEEVCQTTSINDLVELRFGYYSFSPSELEAVTFVCRYMKKIAKLSLLFPMNHLPVFLDFLRKRCLSELKINGASIFGEKEVSQVFSSLMALDCTCNHKHTKLTSLTISGRCATKEGLSIMCKFFENGHARQLERLDLSINNFGLYELRKIFNNGHYPDLTQLCLHGTGTSITDEGGKLLFDILTKTLRKLNTLDVSWTKLTDECISTLVKALQDERCKLTDLSLGGNAIGDKGAVMLFEDALTNKHCKLTKLSLNSCSLTDQCIPSLCKALQDKRCQLTDLSLKYNTICDKGASMLFEDALTNKHCKLTKLNLDDCSLTDQCIPSLCKVLKDQCGLIRLLLQWNNFTENGKELLRDTMNYESCKARNLKVN